MRTEHRRSELINRTMSDRDRAEALLRSLIDARASARRGLSPLRRPELLRPEGSGQTGSPSVDAAIEGTRRLIETYNRVLEDLAHELDDTDIALLEEIATEQRSVRPAA